MLKQLTTFLILTILLTGCSVLQDNPFYYYRHVHNKPTQIGYINYTTILDNWAKTTVPSDASSFYYEVAKVNGGNDGTRYFTVILLYQIKPTITIEYHFVTITPQGTFHKSKLLDRTTIEEYDLEEEIKTT